MVKLVTAPNPVPLGNRKSGVVFFIFSGQGVQDCDQTITVGVGVARGTVFVHRRRDVQSLSRSQVSNTETSISCGVCNRSKLSKKLLIYAAGEGAPATHDVALAGKLLHVRSLQLSGELRRCGR